MRLIPAGENAALVAAYVSEKIGLEVQPDLYQALAILDDGGTFVAGVIVSEFRQHDVQLSTASETPVVWTPEVLRGIFDYVFNQLGCVRCTAVTKKGNRKARAFLEHLGFQLEGNLRLGYDGIKDALIYGMLASECRYLEEPSDGQEVEAEGPGSARSDENSGSAEANEHRDGGSERQPEQDRPVHTAGKPNVQADWY